MRVRQLFAPGLEGSNITLRADASATVTMPGGYRWSVGALDSTGRQVTSPSWVIALVVVVGAVAAAAVAGLMLLWVKQQRRRSSRGVKNVGRGACRVCQQDRCVCPTQPRNSSPAHLRQTYTPSQLARHSLEGVQPRHQRVPSANQQLQGDVLPCSSDGANESAQQHQGSSNDQKSSSLTSSTVSAGLNNWRRAVNHTMLTIMERRLEAQAPGLAGESTVLPIGFGNRESVRLPAVPVVKAHGAARAGGLIPRAAPGMGAPMVLLEEALGRVSS